LGGKKEKQTVSGEGLGSQRNGRSGKVKASIRFVKFGGKEGIAGVERV